jgi:transcriptional regulator with XRE-family HTH domain
VPRQPPQQEPLWREVLGRRLRALRHDQRETLSETAGRAGISPQYLSEVERGRKEPSSEMIAALAGALGITLTELTEQLAGDLRRQQGTTTELRVQQGIVTELRRQPGFVGELRRQRDIVGELRRQRDIVGELRRRRDLGTDLRGQQGTATDLRRQPGTSRGAGPVMLSLAA